LTKIVATADQIYADPSALALLYLRQPASQAVAKWRWKLTGSLPVTHHGRVEIMNAIALAAFRGKLTGEQAIRAWQSLNEDFAAGRFIQVDILWRAALNRAAEFSRTFSVKLGTRSLDVLHISCAVELGLSNFLSFDEKQKALATEAGLKVLAI
jgi:predicted nucleic acid-binding protein